MTKGALPRSSVVVLAAGVLVAGVLCATAIADVPTGLSVVDNFNRSNGAVGSPWVAALYSAPNVISNQAGSSSGAAGAYWSSVGPAVDEEVAATVEVTDSNGVGLLGRYDPTSGTYVLFNLISTNTWRVYWGAPGVLTSEVSVTGDVVSSGDCIAGTVVGTLATFWYQSGCTGSWKAEAAWAGASTAASGYAGLRMGSATGRVDNFAAATYSDPETVTASTIIYTAAATQTVTVGGGGGTVEALGGNCGGTTTDAGGSTVDQAPCTVDLETDAGTGGAALVDIRHLSGWLVGLTLLALVLPLITWMFTRSRGPE